jgi:peptidoglycan L-alanyl-D-glutamate endopeptidase CwlK
MRDITLCHPRLQVLAAKLVEECSKQGLIIKIGETYRTVAEQDALYAQGRTTPGNIVTNVPGSTYSSYHQWGTAFDIFRNDGQGAYNEAGNFFGIVGAIGVSLGLEWGGNWKSPVDKPHFQLPDWGSSTTGIKKVYANPDEFKKTWLVAEIPKEKKSGWKQEDNGWRFYLGDTGECVRNNWYHDIEKDIWYWFDGAGIMVTNTWYQHNGGWYYLNADGVMLKGTLIAESGKVYCLDSDGKMIAEPVTLTPDQNGALQYPGLAE